MAVYASSVLTIAFTLLLFLAGILVHVVDFLSVLMLTESKISRCTLSAKDSQK